VRGVWGVLGMRGLWHVQEGGWGVARWGVWYACSARMVGGLMLARGRCLLGGPTPACLVHAAHGWWEG